MASKLLMLPKTKFNPRFHAITRERELLDEVVKFKQNEQAKKFIIHEAPLSVHGQLHLGHFYNKVYKDIIARYKLLRGYQIPPSMSFECYGPSIEHAAFQQLLEQGTTTLPYQEQTIRKTCAKYVENQLRDYSTQIRRWGILEQEAKFTVSPVHQRDILLQLAQLLERNKILSGKKIIIWSQSRLAEVPLDEVKITQRDSVAYPIKFQFGTLSNELKLFECDVYFIHPVTQIWKMVSMQGFQFTEQQYIVVKDKDVLIMTKSFFNQHKDQFPTYQYQGSLGGDELQDLHISNVLSEENVPILLEQSNGMVCPAHQMEDIPLSKRYSLSREGCVNENGQLCYDHQQFSIMSGEANQKILQILRLNNLVLDFVTSAQDMYYSHKVTGEELILRSVPAWYVKYDETDLEIYQESLQNNTKDEDKTLKKQGQYTTFEELMENLCGEWCITSNSVWGIPMPLFYAKETKKFKKLLSGYLLNPEIVRYFATLVEQNGSDIYWDWNIVDLLPEKYRPLAQYLEKHSLVFDRNFNLPLKSDVIIEGIDQNESFIFSSQMSSMINQEGAYNKWIAHHLIQKNDEKLSKEHNDSIENIIEGVVKLNGQRQYGSGADVLRALITNIGESSLTPSMITFKQEQINFIRKTYWQILGCLEGHHIPNINVDDLSFNDKYMYDQLILYVINITKAYEEYDINLVYQLYMDFMENYVLPYIETVRPKLIAFHSNFTNSLFVLYKILDHTITTISPILCFNSKDIYKYNEKWPQLIVSHVKKAQDNLIRLSLYHSIRQMVHQRIDQVQERIKQKNFAKRLEVVFITEPNSFESDLLDQPEIALFLGCASSVIESSFQNKKRPNHLAMASFVIHETFYHQKIRIECKFYEVNYPECPRCFEHAKQANNEMCQQCDTYIQIEGPNEKIQIK